MSSSPSPGSAIAARLGLPARGTAPGRLWALVVVLLALHVGWVATHLSLVANERINPWKLGGYGMYTVPHKNPLAHVFLYDRQAGRWRELPRSAGKFNSFAFDTANHLHVFRCRPPSEASLVGFLDENPHLRHRELTLVISELAFLDDPIRAERQAQSRVQIAWGGRGRFGYRGEVCGERFEGEVAYAPPDA
ncbi:MAG: hypothetical protein ACFBWO_09860 [Paracoccaceae bacterium]